MQEHTKLYTSVALLVSGAVQVTSQIVQLKIVGGIAVFVGVVIFIDYWINRKPREFYQKIGYEKIIEYINQNKDLAIKESQTTDNLTSFYFIKWLNEFCNALRYAFNPETGSKVYDDIFKLCKDDLPSKADIKVAFGKSASYLKDLPRQLNWISINEKFRPDNLINFKKYLIPEGNSDDLFLKDSVKLGKKHYGSDR